MIQDLLEGIGAFVIGLLFLAWLATMIKFFVYKWMYLNAPGYIPPASAEPVTLSTADRSFINELVADL